MKKLIIIGVGGCAREVYMHAQNSIGYGTEFQIKGFLDGTVKMAEQEYNLLDAPVLGNVYDYEVRKDDVFVIAIGNPRIKLQISEIMNQKKVEWINIVHKTAIVAEDCILGRGNIVFPFVLINCNVVLGDHVIVHGYCDIGHDSHIGDFSSVMAHVHIAGKCSIGRNTYWGTGSRIIDHLLVIHNVTVGAGAVVVHDIKQSGVYVGIPALYKH